MNSMRAIERVTALATARLGAEAFDKLRAEGGTLGCNAITAIAFSGRDVDAVAGEACEAVALDRPMSIGFRKRKRLQMTRFWIFLVCVFVPLSMVSGQSGMDEMTRQRMALMSSHIKQTAQGAGATLLPGSMHMNVFGPEATVGFYTLQAGGVQQQHMVVLETQTDTTRGEAAPPISSANLTFKRYPTRQVVVGDVRIGDKGRTLDVTRARIHEERSSDGFHLLATVTVPIVGTTRSATFKISHPVGAERASIIEGGP